MKKIMREIRIDADKCNGCRACEVICSAYRAEPQSNIVNPQASRIRVFRDEANGLYVPILAGLYTDVECITRMTTTIRGKVYSECSFCRQACPARDLFKEPDTGLPVQCDLCGEPVPEPPLCVKWCLTGALTYVETEEDDETGEVVERIIERPRSTGVPFAQ